MKILHVIPHYYPALSYGGPVTYSYELSNNLVSLGHDVTVYTSDSYDSNSRIKRRYNNLNNVKVIYFRNLSNSFAYSHNLYLTPEFYPKIFKTITEYDLIHIHEIFVLQNVYASYLAKLHKIPFVLSAHGSLTKSTIRGKMIIKKLMLAIGNKYYKNAENYFALSENEKEEYIHAGFDQNKITIIRSGVELFNESPNHQLKSFYNKYSINPKTKLILFMGRLHPIKRIDLLIKAFKLVNDRIGNITLIIAGPDAGEKNKLKKLAETNLRVNSYVFTNFADEDLKNTLLTAASMFVMTSYSEGMSKSLLEAASAGLPLVVTDTCNFRQIEEFKCGIIVKSDIRDLAMAMMKILLNPRLTKFYSDNSKKMIVDQFSWVKVIKRYESVYNSIHNNIKR